MIKLLIGGSPCTYWSICQKNGRETTAEGMGWELFKNYLIAREKFKPDFFLYENNKSADEAIKMQIRHEFGVTDPFQPDFFTPETGVRYVEINSALVSAQNRERFYVHNCGEVGQPKDRGILLKDILETGTAETKNRISANLPEQVLTINRPDGTPSNSQEHRVFSIEGKSVCLQANGGGGGVNTGVYAVPVNTTPKGKSQTVKAQYGNTSVVNMCCYDSTFGASGVAIPASQAVEPADLGSEWMLERVKKTVRNNGAIPPMFNPYHGEEIKEKSPAQITTSDRKSSSATVLIAEKQSFDAQPVEMEKYTDILDRICDKHGEIQTGINLYNEQNLSDKAPCQSKGSQVTSSCAAVVQQPVNLEGEWMQKRIEQTVKNEGAIPTMFNPYNECEVADKAPTQTSRAAVMSSSTTIVPQKAKATMKDRVYKVENGMVEIKGKQYPIKLEDGYYMFRPLTVKEVSRLQTMPDDYCRAVSKAQAYKCLGNGWTAEVIIHILSHALGKVPRDEEIVVLSMYDGIATGRYCLDKMGFTNVRYYAYEIDKYAMQVALSNYPDIIECGDAFQLRDENWRLPE